MTPELFFSIFSGRMEKINRKAAVECKDKNGAIIVNPLLQAATWLSSDFLVG
jgi:hypothetical protein